MEAICQPVFSVGRPQPELAISPCRACTGKSQLLQQLRAFRKGTAQSQLPAKDSCGGQKVQAPEDLAQSGAEKKHEKLWPEGQGAQTKPLGGQSQAPGPGTAREPLVPPLGQP